MREVLGSPSDPPADGYPWGWAPAAGASSELSCLESNQKGLKSTGCECSTSPVLGSLQKAPILKLALNYSRTHPRSRMFLLW